MSTQDGMEVSRDFLFTGPGTELRAAKLIVGMLAFLCPLHNVAAFSDSVRGPALERAVGVRVVDFLPAPHALGPNAS